jgi:Conserved oligomeric complex COG6
MLMTHCGMLGICLAGCIRCIAGIQYDLIYYDVSPISHVTCVFCSLHILKALASERELILVLLDPDATVDSGPAARRLSGIRETDAMKTTEGDITFVLDRIFEGACRPFKVRVEQVLQSQPSLLVSYKLTNTLEFYSFTVSYLYLFFCLFVDTMKYFYVRLVCLRIDQALSSSRVNHIVWHTSVGWHQ